MTLAFAMTIGPGEAEMAIDNLEAIEALYPDAVTWVRDDRTSDGTWERLQGWSAGKRVALSRNAQRNGFHGLAKTVAELLMEVAAAEPELVIKIDPDTILLRRGLDQLFRERFSKYGKGICGSYRVSASGARRKFHNHGAQVVLDMLPIGPKKRQRTLRVGPVGYFGYLMQALARGYRPGEHVQGGLYAIEGSILERLATSGYLNSLVAGRSGMVYAEDVLLTLGVKAVGGTISSANESAAGAPTHIQASRPLQLSHDRLHDARLLAVHPVKGVDSALRSVLRDIRSTSL